MYDEKYTARCTINYTYIQMQSIIRYKNGIHVTLSIEHSTITRKVVYTPSWDRRMKKYVQDKRHMNLKLTESEQRWLSGEGKCPDTEKPPESESIRAHHSFQTLLRGLNFMLGEKGVERKYDNGTIKLEETDIGITWFMGEKYIAFTWKEAKELKHMLHMQFY